MEVTIEVGSEPGDRVPPSIVIRGVAGGLTGDDRRATKIISAARDFDDVKAEIVPPAPREQAKGD